MKGLNKNNNYYSCSIKSLNQTKHFKTQSSTNKRKTISKCKNKKKMGATVDHCKLYSDVGTLTLHLIWLLPLSKESKTAP